VTENRADFGLVGRTDETVFLRSFIERITRPLMPDDRPDEFLATQAIADFSVRAGALGRKKTGWTISKSSRKFTSDDGLEQIDQGMEDQGIPACAESVSV
jgi:hypothetical protein